MSDHDARPPVMDDEIDLWDLFIVVWKGRWLILASVFIFSIIGVAYSLWQPNIYHATTLVAPADGDVDGLNGMSSQLGGLANLAGISLGSGSSNKATVAKEILQSGNFLRDFIYRHDLVPQVFAAKGWDEKNNRWEYDQDIYDPSTMEWLMDQDGKSKKPTDWELVRRFKEENLKVSENNDTGFISVTIRSFSAIEAKRWVELLIQDLNDHIRKQDIAESEARIDFLEAKLKETTVSGMQNMFYQLIENETRQVMLANARPEYIFTVLDPAMVPDEKSEPRRLVICIIAAFLGAIVGAFLVLLNSLRHRKRHE